MILDSFCRSARRASATGAAGLRSARLEAGAKRMLWPGLRTGSWHTATAKRDWRAHEELLLGLRGHGPHGWQGLDVERCAHARQRRCQLCQPLLNLWDAPASAALHRPRSRGFGVSGSRGFRVQGSVQPQTHRYSLGVSYRCMHALPATINAAIKYARQ